MLIFIICLFGMAVQVYHLGIVGTSKNVISKPNARKELISAINEIKEQIGEKEIVIVSGGGLVPYIAFDYAKHNDWKCIQVVCPRVGIREEVQRIEIGNTFGDESETFLKMIDGLIRIGGGPQSHNEMSQFKILKPKAITIEKEVPLLPTSNRKYIPPKKNQKHKKK